jgi:uncharacterized protein DUF1588
MKRISLLLFAAAFAVPACSTGDSGGGDDVSATCGNGVCDPNETSTNCPADCSSGGDEWDQQLNSRVVDYNAALRIAALRLTGALPTMAEITQVSGAPDDASKKAAYEGLVQQYMNTDAFKQQMFYFWRNTFKQGETAMLDTAPAFAAMLSVNNGNYTDLFTATSGNCPTFDGTATFTPAECGNGGPISGVLTNPGSMAQFNSNFAFRRTRWVQETFVCTKFPAEVSATPTDVGAAAPYTSPWPFSSIAGTDNGGRINFHDTQAVICANCHSTINHIAPLFAYYDANGMYQTAIAVTTPLDGAPLAKMSDYLPTGEATAWRMGVPAADIPALGHAMATDPDVAACGVARIWNWALGKTDIVDTLQEVPKATIQAQIDNFTASGFKLKDMIYAVYTSDDFVKF